MDYSSFQWSWKAFVGPKSTDDPDSPYYIPVRDRTSLLSLPRL
jgi:hypothetical protein